MANLISLVSFNGANGAQPEAGLTTDASGDLFGTTYQGGTGGLGTVFEIADTNNEYSSTPITIASFNSANGAQPLSNLVADSAGDFYGTTSAGGTGGVGTIFEILKTTGGYAATPSVVLSFSGTNGSDPRAGLVADSLGDLFGTSFSGGASGDGTVFGFSATVGGIESFGGTNGASPSGGLIVDSAGNLVGTTTTGGANNDGTVFEIAKTASGYASTPTALASFNGTNGSGPQGSLIADSTGDLFGTTASGGAANDGTVFEITNTASGYSSTPITLASFNGSNGSTPEAGLIADAAGDLFGTTYTGGTSNDGTVFEIIKTPAGYASTPITLINFNGANGKNPQASLVADAYGDLFGTTSGGGANNDGSVFELSNAGFQVVAILGTVVGLIPTHTTVTPFTSVVVADLSQHLTETVTIILSAATHGALSNLGGGTYDSTNGVYTVAGTAAAVTTAVDGLVFTPAGQVPAGQSVTTSFTIVDTNSNGDIARDSSTGVDYTPAAGPISAATAVQDFSAGLLAAGTQVQDSAANVSANLDGLQSIATAGDLGSIALTDGGTPSISLTAAQLTSDASVLHDIGNSYALSISAAAPNVTIAGLTPQDVAVFSGNASEYTIAASGTGTAFTVTDTGTGRTSVDHLSNIEFVQFADRMIFVTTPAEAQIALLYQGALGRTPDVPGLVGWQQAFATEPASAQQANDFTALAETPVAGLPDLAYGFTQSTEFQQKYGTLTNTQFVTQLYANVLDRAPDTAGLNGWLNALAQGQTREWVLVGFVESQEAYQNAEMGYVGQSGTHAPWLVVL